MGMEMEASIEWLVQKIKEDVFSPRFSAQLYSFVPCSAYDTAWVAMIPHADDPDRPMFPQCLHWVLGNQNVEGFWGETDQHPDYFLPTLDCLTSTLACMALLNKWDVGSSHIDHGLRFLRANTEMLLLMHRGRQWPHWFAIIFPGMLDIAYAGGLEIFPQGHPDIVKDVFRERERILGMKATSEQGSQPPLALYLEALPTSYRTEHEAILGQQSGDGSLFQSPSATACAFMLTKNRVFLDYLDVVVQRCGDGVPPEYPVDEDYVMLCLVDHLERLGCCEHFPKEIEDVLHHAYSNWETQEAASHVVGKHDVPFQIVKDSLAFRLLRGHGYNVSPRFCWFVQDANLLSSMDNNYTHFLGAMYGIYRASHCVFPQEVELEMARDFSKALLQRGLPSGSLKDGFTNFQKEIDHELRVPWLARMDHLEHRTHTERYGACHFWIGKASPYRLPCSKNTILLQLAVKGFTERQSIYRDELTRLKRWSEEWGLSSMGFGREKTTYLYFGVAATTCFPYISDIRLVVAKCGIVVTVADDFFDEKGSLDELYNLTEAVQRWNVSGLSGHGKTIFNALDELVNDIAIKAFRQRGQDIKEFLRNIWRETFESWMKEAEWSRRRHAPSIDEYLNVATISIAIHAIALPACYLIGPKSPEYTLNSGYSTITRLLMLSARLLNETQSYQKEEDQGKLNMVLLYMKENPKANIEDSIAYIGKILDSKRKEFLELVLLDGHGDLPREWKDLHLSCLKVFQMFFNSSNAFDSPTAVLHGINMAFHEPLVEHAQTSLSLHSSLHHGGLRNKKESPLEELSRGNYLPAAKAKCRLHMNYRAPSLSGVIPFEKKQSMRFLGSKASDAYSHPSSSCLIAPVPHIPPRPLLWI